MVAIQSGTHSEREREMTTDISTCLSPLVVIGIVRHSGLRNWRVRHPLDRLLCAPIEGEEGYTT
jgi:hypothetical protein